MMEKLSKSEAIELALNYFRKIVVDVEKNPPMVLESLTKEFSFGWMFYINSKKAIDLALDSEFPNVEVDVITYKYFGNQSYSPAFLHERNHFFAQEKCCLDISIHDLHY